MSGSGLRERILRSRSSSERKIFIVGYRSLDYGTVRTWEREFEVDES